jgi:AraC-like DNA-binding protein
MDGEALIYNISVQATEAAESLRETVGRFSFPSAGRLSEEALSSLVAVYDILLQEARAGGEDVALRVSALCNYILLLLLGAVNRSLLPPVPKGAMQYVLAATAIVREEYQRDLRLGEVADRLGLSSGYLSSIISECLGATFKEYLAATRVRRAMALLAGTADTVTEIAFASGFGSFSAFERVFSKLCGMTPREYRRLSVN